MVRNIIALIILYVPNQLHFKTDLGIVGLNFYNILLIFALLVVFTSGARPSVGAPLKGRLLLYMVVLVYGFLLGTGHEFHDVVALKTAISYPLLFFVAYNGTPDLKTARVYLGVILFALLLMSLEIAREMLTQGFGTSRRFAGPFGHGEENANYAGTYLSTFGAIAIAIALFYKENKKYRLFAAGVMALAIFANFYTFSRSSLLAIALSIAVLATVKSRVMLVVVLAALVNYTLWAPEGVRERIDESTVETEMGQAELDESAGTRIVIWESAGELMKDRPLGVGLNRFQDRIAQYLPPKTRERDAHNHFILVMAEIGLLGFLVLLWLWFGMIKAGFRLLKFKDDSEARSIGLGYLCALMSLLIGNMFHSQFYSGELMGNFWVLTALVIRFAQLKDEALTGVAAGANPKPKPHAPQPTPGLATR